jgi:polyisoprenoid-binding protein YceI
MRKIVECCAVVVAWAASTTSVAAVPAQYIIDPSHSTVQFAVTHIGVSRVFGRFNEISGNFAYDPARVAAGSAQIVLKVASIDTALARRDDLLRGKQGFKVAEFPEIRFVATAISGSAERFALSGSLSLLGVSRPVTFQVRRIGAGPDPWGGYRAGFEATTMLRRSDFGMTSLAGAIGDDVAVTVEIEGQRRP